MVAAIASALVSSVDVLEDFDDALDQVENDLAHNAQRVLLLARVTVRVQLLNHVTRRLVLSEHGTRASEFHDETFTREAE